MHNCAADVIYCNLGSLGHFYYTISLQMINYYKFLIDYYKFFFTEWGIFKHRMGEALGRG